VEKNKDKLCEYFICDECGVKYMKVNKSNHSLSKSVKIVNSKSVNFAKFKEYIKNKNKVNIELFTKYNDVKFRKYKWYAYINKKRTEDNLINEIKMTFGKDSIVVLGDWFIGKQMRNFISTPNLGLKRKLNEHFKVYSIDEFRTSQLNWRTEEICENLCLPDKKGVIRKMHSILTYQMENKRLGCVNRDKNSIMNMKKITDYFLEHRDRPERYKRGFDLDNKKSKLKKQ
jgi:hypothetical protein